MFELVLQGAGYREAGAGDAGGNDLQSLDAADDLLVDLCGDVGHGGPLLLTEQGGDVIAQDAAGKKGKRPDSRNKKHHGHQKDPGF